MKKRLELTPQQEDVYNLLKNHKDTEKFRFSEWYLGAFYALDNPYNPNRLSQAANSLRELTEKLELKTKLKNCDSIFNGIVHHHLFSEEENELKQGVEKLDRYLFENLQYEKTATNPNDQNFLTRGYSPKLKLTPRQKDVYSRLKNHKDTEKFRFSEWYLGALYALDNPYNPDRLSQAAISLRELIEVYISCKINIDIGNRKDVRKEESVKIFHKQNDPNFDVLPLSTQQSIQRVSLDLLKKLNGITHHKCLSSQDDLKAYIADLERFFYQLESDITGDEEELKNLLNQSDINDADKAKILRLILKRGSNFIFFFREIDDDETWLPVLKKKAIFHETPEQIQDWYPISYLEKISEKKPKEVIETILNIQETDNPSALRTVSQIALKTPVEESIKLKDYVSKYLKVRILDPSIVNKIIKHWSKENIGMNATMGLIKEIVSFELNSMEGAEPQPKLRVWQYCEVLRQGISFVTKDKPIEVSRILIEATSDMLDMRRNSDDYNDASEVWCKDLDKVDEKCRGSFITECWRKLIETLTFACKQVYDKEYPPEIEELDQLLAKQKWSAFRRIQCHLYFLNLNAQTRPKIQRLILGYEYYGKNKYGYEFQRMVHKACKHFGSQLLTKDEWQDIFDAIFNATKKHLHRETLRPFESVLFGKYKKYYERLSSSATAAITDEDYRNKSITIVEDTFKSNIFRKDLKALSNQKLLALINSYQGGEFTVEEGNYIEIGAELVKGFEDLFEESIITDPSGRIDFWLKNLEKIKYSIYIHAIFNKISEDVRKANHAKLNIWFKFCKKVLSKSSEELTVDCYGCIVGFIEACLSVSAQLPVEQNHKSLLSLLSTLCTEAGFKMSKNVSWTLTKEDDYEQDWRNEHGRARCRAFKALIKYGHWIRRHDTRANTQAITTIIESRFNSAQYPLTLPEREIFAEKYISIYGLNIKWAKKHKFQIFPRDDLTLFKQTFSQFLGAHQICSQTCRIVYDELVYSVERLSQIQNIEDLSGRDNNDFIESLEKYLSYCYIDGVYPLRGEKSLLRKYYHRIRRIPERQGMIFYTMGDLARYYKSDTDQKIKEKFKDYFDWRFHEENKELREKELEQFDPWFQADCFDFEWKLDSYSKILDLNIVSNGNIYGQSKMLKMLLKQNLEKVIECFEKLVKVIKGKTGFEYYMDEEEIKTILVTGLESKNKTVRKNAERAYEHLLEIPDHSSWVSGLVKNIISVRQSS